MTAVMSGQAGPMWRCQAVLGQARELLEDARSQPLAADRFRISHLAALRASAALLAAYSGPGQRLVKRPTSAWVLLTKLAPPMSAWAAYFSAGATRRAAADAGVAGAVSSHDADELVRSVDTFIQICASTISARADGVPSGDEFGWMPAPPVRHMVLTAQTG